MAYSRAAVWSCLIAVMLLGFQANAQLSSSFYSSTCPNLISIVRTAITNAVNRENRMAASILRLHFHDCFVNGCDASILLDGSSGEKNAGPNVNSARGFDVIDNVKAAVESSCKGVVSCADILALSAREAVVALRGPSWTVVFGRRDSTTSSQSTANSAIPPPSSTASRLITSFQNQGLSTQDLVALSGSHTIGQAQCTNFRARLYNGTSGDTIDASFKSNLERNCPSTGGNSNLAPLDLQTPVTFDNLYFKNLQAQKGLLFSDQQLFSGGQSSLMSTVNTYANNQQAFFSAFATAMVKMGNINPLTGSNGQIRANCRKTN
ncbi:peroxidase P7 [Selaginella moellendorffii]|uniref:peroxidase P7 n=1 Tax=Selaginella moellendorffii TaxID=88036 RepID=UPI000D1CE3BA|nr:peroxidase P7 [Selaginella moellendorffii]|eukprot:XP_024535693.1 peroxidase P7 [Selaginella moellendorffii]